ncbi:MAG: PQQ-binding-like beta-propeller repeat protein [Gemmataceae bacterium]|nr:PQQ-binding-like beta-propeller repeat protein [Gemmataceae bacterium]
MRRICALILSLVFVSGARAQGPWSTYRGNPQRTGHADSQAGPATPKVLWVHKSKDHYIASPLPAGDRLFVSGLGAFNIANFTCLNADPKAKDRVLWNKTTPYLKLPTVSSPALSGSMLARDRIIFGDGMHQTDGATLHCLDIAGGLPLWQHPVPGTLVHLEGSPALVDGKAYIGGGAAGVLCVELDRVTLEGKSMDLAQVRKVVAQRWKELQAKYQEEKKKDPLFAVPPNEDQLPKANPVRVWQQGAEKWHVDAPVNVVGERVLVGSAFLDKEKVGDRAIYALDARTGKPLWRTPLKLNPWGGPSAEGATIVVSGSSIGYDVKALKGAKGFIAAYDLETGKEKWHKDITGGVVACAALADGAAVVTATDGKVRAFDLASGERRWIYEAKMPLFAPVAIAKGIVYAGDLKGVVHAVDLKSGIEQWKLDLGAHPAVQSPGMIYAGPVVQGGRLYVATCNLEGPAARQGTAVVCVGDQ